MEYFAVYFALASLGLIAIATVISIVVCGAIYLSKD
jgi:hypothetical protein